jgi:hypothetical protein
MIIQQPSYEIQRLRGKVFLNGQEIKWKEWSVEIPAYDEADNFNIRAPWNVGGADILSSNADTTPALATEKDVPLRVELDGQTLIEGLVDAPEWTFSMQGASVVIDGTGKIGRLVETKKIRNIKNRTASSVAKEVFSSHGISAKVTETNRKIGTYADDGQTTSTDQDDWQLLNWLAEWEGFAVRVRGNSGFFGPPDQIEDVKQDPLTLTYGTDCEVQQLRREKTGGREYIVEGRSYFGGRTIVEFYPRAPKKEGETAVIFRRALTGLSQEQLRRRVKSIHDELTKKDVVGTLMVPKYLDVASDRRIELKGVGLGLSRVYYCTKVGYQESMDGIVTTIHISSKIKGAEQ